jgi:hypothetical protein
MTRNTLTIDIRRSPTEVFEYLATVSNLPAWVDGAVAAAAITDDPKGRIGVFFLELREGPQVRRLQGETLVHRPPRELTFHLWDDRVDIRAEYRLSELEKGTRLESVTESDPKSAVFRFVMGRFLTWMNAHKLRADLERLRDVLEAQRPQARA